MNIRIKNKIIIVIFENSEKIEIKNYKGIIKEIIRDVHNGSKEFIFDFHKIKSENYDTSVIGLVSGLITYINNRDCNVTLKGVNSYGKKIASMCGINADLEKLKFED